MPFGHAVFDISYKRMFESIYYGDVIMGAMASQITSLTIVCSNLYSGADQRKHESSVSLAFVRGIHRWPVNSPHKGPVTRKMSPFNDVILICAWTDSWRRCGFETLQRSLWRQYNEFENRDLLLHATDYVNEHLWNFRWLPQDTFDDMSVSVQVMVWCHQATGHYLSQCWPRFISPHGVIMLE